MWVSDVEAIKFLKHSSIKIHRFSKNWIPAKIKNEENSIKISINPYENIP